MLLNICVLLVSFVTWVAVLWFALTPRLADWSNIAVAGAHALPPLLPWLAWLVARRRKLRRACEDAQTRERRLQEERQAELEAARKRYDETMQRRRFGCECRIVAMAGIALRSEQPLLAVDVENVDVRTRPANEAGNSTPGTLVERLNSSLRDALAAIYGSCEATLALPVFVQPPTDVSGEEAVAAIRMLWHEFAAETGMQAIFDADAPAIRFLPISDSAANSICTLFDSAPDLPGAVVVAFDSPLAHAGDCETDGEIDPLQRERVRRTGQPSEGVVAMMLTNPELGAMLTAIDGIHADSTTPDSMAPYWQRSTQTEGPLAELARVDHARRAQLAGLPVLGSIRRADYRDLSTEPVGFHGMMQLVQQSLEQAQINAGLVDAPFTHDGAHTASDSPRTALPEPLEPATPPAQCRRLVHNAGSVDYAGKRLAALGSAMHYFKIDLNPVDTDLSTNLATRVGDLGRASGIGQLALAVAHTAATQGSALCAEFTDRGLAVSFVTPMSHDT